MQQADPVRRLDLVMAQTREQLADVKKPLSPPLILAQEEEVQQLIARYEAHAAHGTAVAELKLLERTADLKSANALVGWLL